MKMKLFYVITIITAILLLSGCSKEVDLSLNFIKEPDVMTISSMDKLNELSEPSDKLVKLSQRENLTEKEKEEFSKLMNEVEKIQNYAIVELKDESVIHKLIYDIKATKGPFYKKSNFNQEDIMFKIDLKYDSLQGKINNNNLANYFKEGYILSFMVFSDETMGLPIYSENAERNLETIEVKITHEVFSQIKDLYESQSRD